MENNEIIKELEHKDEYDINIFSKFLYYVSEWMMSLVYGLIPKKFFAHSSRVIYGSALETISDDEDFEYGKREFMCKKLAFKIGLGIIKVFDFIISILVCGILSSVLLLWFLHD